MLGSPEITFWGHGTVSRQLGEAVCQRVESPPALLGLRLGPEVRVDTPHEGIEIHCEGPTLRNGRTLHRRDRHHLRLIPRAAEVKVTELVGHKLQASEMDSLVRDETGNVPSPASVVGDELRVPKRTGPARIPATMLTSRAAIKRSHGGESA
jgi:hypothetical protein